MQNTYLPTPQPGEIWELKRILQTPMKFSNVRVELGEASVTEDFVI